jgi:regulator of replication initiation timing
MPITQSQTSAMDKAEMLNLISKLTHQNTTKDGEIAALKSAMTRSLKETRRLEAKVEAHHLSTTLADERLTAMTLERDHFINKARRLEASLTSIAAQEESTLATIQAVTQTTLTAAKAAINQATDQMSSADDADETPPPPPPPSSSPTIAAALSTARLDIDTVKTTVHRAITVFFHMRHFLLVKRGFPSLLAETPVRCPVVVDDESFSPPPSPSLSSSSSSYFADNDDNDVAAASQAGKRKRSADDDERSDDDDVVARWMDEMLEGRMAKRVKCEDDDEEEL